MRIQDWTLQDVLEENSRAYPNNLAVVCGDARYTYPELRERVYRLANVFAAAGVDKGGRVLWLGQNSHRVLEGLLACACLGAYFCPVNWRQSASELAFVIDDLEPGVVLWQDEEVGAVMKQARELATWRGGRWLQHDATGADTYEGALAAASADLAPREIDADETVLIMYTAAFQGRPNGAMLSHVNLMTQNLVLARAQDLSSSTVFLNSGPLFHIGTLMFTFATFHLGGTNVFVRRSDAQTIAEAIHANRCTYGFVVGKSIQEIIEINRDGRYDLKSFRAEHYDSEWADAWANMVTILPLDKWPRWGGFGQTEATGLVAMNYYGWGGTGTHGRTTPAAHVRIFDNDGNELPPGEVGEVVVRGPLVMRGYYNRPEINARRQRNGWHFTNDLGRRELDGTLSFIGPKMQMIKSGVENIYPAEVEGCLRRHPAVADCAVIGIPDPVWVQNVKAIVQLAPGANATEAEIIEHCKQHLASYKKPKTVEFIAAIPRKSPFEIDYRALDEQFGGGNYPGGATPVA
jgi:long-chain acyl-CoA synthetase